MAIIVCTMLVSAILCSIFRRFLTRDSIPLPSMSIYLNILRILIWCIGITILLSTCLGIDVTGFVTALGIGGIAISLGLKDTISNLISGVQVTSCRIMNPGDHVMIANYTGTVIDTTWRHTTIQDMYGETIIVPNSIINSNAIVKLHPYSVVRVHITLHSKSAALTSVSDRIIQEVRMAVQHYGTLAEDVKIKFSSIEDGGAKGSVLVKFAESFDGATTVDIKDAIIKVIAPYVEAAKE